MYQKYILSNGVQVITEKIPYVKSVSLGIWIGTGSIDENIKNNGISHFIEHMMFKGTKKRTAKEIAQSIDNVGGQLNAFTSKECTCYYAKVLDGHIDIAIDVLTDMVFHSNFDDKEIEKEKSVVLEEINMYEDSPEDIAHDLLLKTVFPKDSLGLPILGSSDRVMGLKREDLMEYIEKNYTADHMVVAVAGNFDEKLLIDLLEEKFIKFQNKLKEKRIKNKPDFISNTSIKYKDIEQIHLCLGLEGIGLESEESYSLLIMNNVFGGGMSSRLFQSIREDKGLAYSVYSYPSFYKETGLFTIYAGISPSQLEEVTKLIGKEIMDIKIKGLSEDEIQKSKEQLKGNYMLGLESTSSRMTSIGKSQLLTNKIHTPKEIIEKIDRVRIKDVNDVIDKIFNMDKMSISAVGKLDENMNISSLLKR